MEILAGAMAKILETPLSSPFAQEIIIVQSKGMEHWISMELARRHGICANIDFPFPNAFVYEMFQKVIPDFSEDHYFDPDIMAWNIMKLILSCITKPAFKSIKSYLDKPNKDLRRFQLAERIADTFDQYLVFRPEMISKWERGQDSNWQAMLWRELVKEKESKHRGSLAGEFFNLIEKFGTRVKNLPERVSIFGISYLPPFHMQVFAAISRFVEVNLFIMNPCSHYWGDILSKREIKRVAKSISAKGSETESSAKEMLHIEHGNDLLASMGTLGRDFFDLTCEFAGEEVQLFVEPGEDSLLSCVQSDIMNLVNRGADKNRPGKNKIVAEDDVSIQIHSCHGPMREIQVLYDNLLEMFEKDPDLTPEDILVMMPDIETYSPYIQSVFDLPADDSKRIPFSIADRSIIGEGSVTDVFLEILDLKTGRFSAADVFAILESRPVREKFDISAADLELIQNWINDTRIRWGINGRDRKSLGFPEFSENTWQAGIKRLVLGYALPGKDERRFAGILPYDHIEGDDVSVLGRFVEFADQLFSHVKSLNRVKTISKWSVTLTDILEKFFLADKNSEKEMQIIERTLSGLINMQDLSDFHDKVDFDVIYYYLEQNFKKKGFGSGFITSGVTFCAMLPMRSIPFKVICLVGMNSDVYPKRSKQLEFDLVAKFPKPGDRSRRNDDRYLFLEVLLSARKKLYISYVGNSIRDNSPIPPSALVSELTDYIKQGFTAPGRDILGQTITSHRLQAFSPEYFKENNNLLSYSKENFYTACRLINTRKTPVSFITKGLPGPGKEWKTVDVNDLCAFYHNPSRFLLNKRIGIYLEESALILEENEPFDIGGLDKYLLEQRLLEKRMSGYDLNGLLSLNKASGILPHGAIGDCIYGEITRKIDNFTVKTEPYMQGRRSEAIEVDLDISDFKLIGKIDDVYQKHLLYYRFAKLKAKDHLGIWIRHLVLNSIESCDYPKTSLLVGLDPDRSKRSGGQDESAWEGWEYLPVKNSVKILKSLLDNFWKGLVKPLQFFPQSSLIYAAQVVEKDRPFGEALEKAHNIWAGGKYSRGEIDDEYFKLCFGKTDPLDSDFADTAVEVFKPLIQNRNKI